MPITLYTSQLFLREIREREEPHKKQKQMEFLGDKTSSLSFCSLNMAQHHLLLSSLCLSILNELRGLGSSSFYVEISLLLHFHSIFFVVVIVTKTLTRCV